MKSLRDLAPWQIILIALATLLVFAVASYFIVVKLTTPPAPTKATSSIPGNLDSKSNQDVVKSLDNFQPPAAALGPSEPLRTPDPGAPSTVNPFTR